jgi:signal transduction histidine kinase/ActR/RegA family two-component response regulator
VAIAEPERVSTAAPPASPFRSMESKRAVVTDSGIGVSCDGHPAYRVYFAMGDSEASSHIIDELNSIGNCEVVIVPRLVDAWKLHSTNSCAVFIAQFPLAQIEDDVFVRSFRELPGGEYGFMLAIARDEFDTTLHRILQYPVDDVLLSPVTGPKLRLRLHLAFRRLRELEERIHASAGQRGRSRYERLLVNISTQFINIAPAELSDGINSALPLVGEFTQSDRAYVSFLNPDGSTVDKPFEWCAPSISAHRNILKGTQRSDFKWFMRQYYEQRMINVPDVSVVPEDAVAERELMAAQGIQALICLPLTWDGKIIGYLGLDSVQSARTWSEDIISLLTVIGQILANAWERCRAESLRGQLEAQMLQAQKLESLGVLAGGIAHDFNNLLVGILANAGVALLELPRNSEPYDRVAQIELAAQRAGELTNQMLAYAGKGRFILQRIDLSKVVREMAHLLESAISKKTTIRYDFAQDLPQTEGDLAQIRQVIMNLITNAADSIRGHEGTITLSTGVVVADREYLSTMYVDDALKPDTYIYVQVSDDGCGMDDDTKSRIFDPFFTTKFSGHGLGLAAVLGIVRSHRGSIHVTSEPKRGTTFRVILPCLKDQAPACADMVDEAPGTGVPQLAATVLVVDDEPMVRDVAQIVLEKAGCTVLTAQDAVDAIALYSVRHEKIDIVLLDLMMPGLNGEEAFRELARINPEVHVLLSSGYTEEEATRCFGTMALAGFIQKPYRAADLITKIAGLVQRRNAAKHSL